MPSGRFAQPESTGPGRSVPLDLSILPDELSVCRLPARSEMPAWAVPGGLTSMSWTADETSVVCASSAVPAGGQVDAGWRAFVVAGPLALSLTGVLLSIAQPLADAGIGVFAVSTHDTDYVLVKQTSLDAAIAALTAFGHRVSGK
ncbi:MAG: hypothetical protein A2Y74_01600 [Actinobacteria bacterium RBG_13_63_9]|nr:MAG: hypothetical protein A2Y74_01600 [Actinobacteria bacterium RBG_13_63_9]